MYSNCSGHMTKTATTPIYGKNPLKFFFRTRRPMTFGLGMYRSTDLNIVSSETTSPIEFKFYMKIPYDRLAKIYTNCSGHMTKMATTPIYSKFF